MGKGNEVKKNKGGRPPYEITPAVLQQAEDYAARGLNQEQIALCLGINVDTLINKKHEYVEFSDALKRGKAKGIAFVANKLLDNVKKGDNTATIFYLKCQANWRDTQKVELTGEDGAPIQQQVSVTHSIESIDERINELCKGK